MKDSLETKQPIKNINGVGVLVQAVMSISLLYVLIITIFIREFIVLDKVLLGLTLLSMAYNNHDIYKRKGFTAVYGIVGLLVLLTALFN